MKKQKKNTKMIRNIMIAVVSVVVVAVVLMFIGNKMEANTIREKQEIESYQGWLFDNCECLARERFYCSNSDFKVVGGLCVNKYGNVSTFKISGCSLYSCPYGNAYSNVTWNNKSWEPILN